MLLIRKAIAAGFRVITSFILGFPEETLDDLKMTLALHQTFLDLGVIDSQLHAATLLHGATLYDKHKGQLCFDGQISDLADQCILPEHLSIIRGYPHIFAPFFYIPSLYVDRRQLLELMIFGRLLTQTYRTMSFPDSKSDGITNQEAH